MGFKLHYKYALCLIEAEKKLQNTQWKSKINHLREWIHPLTERDQIRLDYFGNELGKSIAERLLFVTLV